MQIQLSSFVLLFRFDFFFHPSFSFSLSIYIKLFVTKTLSYWHFSLNFILSVIFSKMNLKNIAIPARSNWNESRSSKCVVSVGEISQVKNPIRFALLCLRNQKHINSLFRSHGCYGSLYVLFSSGLSFHLYPSPAHGESGDRNKRKKEKRK